jgi:hypothetical protein
MYKRDKVGFLTLQIFQQILVFTWVATCSHIWFEERERTTQYHTYSYYSHFHCKQCCSGREMMLASAHIPISSIHSCQNMTFSKNGAEESQNVLGKP